MCDFVLFSAAVVVHEADEEELFTTALALQQATSSYRQSQHTAREPCPRQEASRDGEPRQRPPSSSRAPSSP